MGSWTHGAGESGARGPEARHQIRWAGQDPGQAWSAPYLGVQVDWPSLAPASPPPELLCDLYRGCLLWGAVGDALGRAVEGWDPAAIRQAYGPEGIRDYDLWPGWGEGLKGIITDDTQLTIEVARSLLATGGRFDPEDFARRLVAWFPIGRGTGQATTEAVQRLMLGESWWQAGAAVHSGGNGAAMRAAPVGLAWALHPSLFELRRDAVLSALPTHTHPVGVAGAVVIAAAVAWCIRMRLGGAQGLDAAAFLDFVTRAIDGTEPEPTMERKPGGRAVRLRDRIAELPDLLTWDNPEKVFAHTWNGAFALESVPAALYCFLHTPDDPRQVILIAVNGGHDADTVASMAGNLAGAWCGAKRLRQEVPEWWAELEVRDELIGLADGLADMALMRRLGHTS